MVVIMLKLSWP